MLHGCRMFVGPVQPTALRQRLPSHHGHHTSVNTTHASHATAGPPACWRCQGGRAGAARVLLDTMRPAQPKETQAPHRCEEHLPLDLV